MEGREQRLVIPAMVALISAFTTLWLGAGFKNGPFYWFPFVAGQGNENSDLLKALVTLGIANLAVGYICHVIYTYIMLHAKPEIRFIDFARLFRAFGFDHEKLNWKDLDQGVPPVREDILAEFHLRLHSHAPKSLRDHCSRRNNEWYIAHTSIIALILGFFLSILFMWVCLGYSGSCLWKHIRNWQFFTAVGVLTMVIIFLYLLGNRWNREFWEVCWKWISHDVSVHPPPSDWYERIRNELNKSKRSHR